MGFKTGRVSPGGGVDESPRAVPPSVPAPPCSVSSRDPNKSPMVRLYTARVSQMKGPYLVGQRIAVRLPAPRRMNFGGEVARLRKRPVRTSNACRTLAKKASLQVHAAEEVLKARVGARRVEDGTHLHTRQPDLADLACLHEMSEGPILVVQRQPQAADSHVRYMLSSRPLLQTASQLEALRPAAGQGVNPG